MKFARKMLKNYDEDVWKKNIAFYLDGVSFAYKRMWIQDGDPSQKRTVVKRALCTLNCPLLLIPPRSPDMNPIENIFNIIRKRIEREAMQKRISKETNSEFEKRIRGTFMSLSQDIIDRTIASMNSRMKQIIHVRGERLKY